MKIGIIGCGAIGGSLARFLHKEYGFLHAVCDISQETIASLNLPVKTLSLQELITECDLVIEAASKDVVKEILQKVIDAKKSLMIMSVGGLLDCVDLLEQARKKSISVYCPTGAIAGVDGLHAAKLAGLQSVTLTTTKSPKSLGLDVNEKKIIFEGNARDAIEKFPKNINVSSLLSLVGLGAEKTRVNIVCDPKALRNTHEIVIESNAGKITSTIENVPSENPKTSALAIYSAKATLKKMFDTVKLGT
jgi:aspartate dehydrogenase